MPEEQEPIGGTIVVSNENGTEANYPSRSPIMKGKNTLAKVTLLDGTVKDLIIEVTYTF